jgi:hypothetical protein
MAVTVSDIRCLIFQRENARKEDEPGCKVLTVACGRARVTSRHTGNGRSWGFNVSEA